MDRNISHQFLKSCKLLVKNIVADLHLYPTNVFTGQKKMTYVTDELP